MSKDTDSKEIKQALTDLMRAKGLSQGKIGSAIDRSGSAISQWLAGKYEGDSQALEKDIRDFLTRMRAREEVLPKDVPFVSTSITKKVFEIAEICHLECELGVCTGEAGIGKTMAVMEYGLQNTDVVLIQADLSYSAKVLFSQLCEALDLQRKGTIQDMLDRVVLKLKGSGRMIIIDEAEHLPYRALDLLRRVFDKAGVGVLLVGMKRLWHNLRQEKGDFAQLYSRVGVVVKLPGRLSQEDIKVLVTSMLPGGKADWAPFEAPCDGNARKLSKLTRRARRIGQINGMPVNSEVVEAASQLLMF